MENAQERGVQITSSESSLFSVPGDTLDPRLFRNGHLIPSVRDGILSALFGHLNAMYVSPESWTTVWLAGSGVSYQWAANRSPADLDCLVGVDFSNFRRSNDKYFRLSDREIASMLNEGFREYLQPTTEEFLGEFELTFYVNVIADINKLKPYAAYSVTNNDWTVAPSSEAHAFPDEYFARADRDIRMATDIVDRYQEALNVMSMARNEAATINAKTMLELASKQGAALFEDIHGSRGHAFSPSGSGYADYANFRWQYAKANGIIKALKNLPNVQPRDVAEMPSAATLIRRAATYRSN